MTIKTYAAIMTGALAMMVTALLLWAGTQLPLQDVAAFALVAYYVGLVGAFAVIERLDRRRQRIPAEKLGEQTKKEQEKGKEMAS